MAQFEGGGGGARKEGGAGDLNWGESAYFKPGKYFIQQNFDLNKTHKGLLVSLIIWYVIYHFIFRSKHWNSWQFFHCLRFQISLLSDDSKIQNGQCVIVKTGQCPFCTNNASDFIRLLMCLWFWRQESVSGE